MGGIHAVEHAAISLFPLFALCDRNDIGGICFPHHPQVGKGAIFIYDAYPGGIGLAQRGFEVIEELLGKTLALLRSCECENGCPSCIHSPKCGAGNKPLDKRAAMMVLKGLLGEISLEELATASSPDDTDAQAGPESATEAESDARRLIFLDIETQRLAQEVGGWRKAHLMRVSVAVVFDSVENDFRVFFEKDTDELMSLLDKADLVIGFNIKGFDYKVLNAYSTKDLSSIPTFDILEDIHRRLGFRITLDHLARETLSQEKLADGIKAVEWFRNKEFEKLIAYCKQDVRVTRDIFRFGVEQGHLIYKDKKTDQRLRLKVDWKLDDMIQPVKPSERK
ncbi:MAG: DEAD/DEAH box helicase, partial [Deltaproteobacteria bacterium CG_4_8_14_3_um_filter_51_11]